MGDQKLIAFFDSQIALTEKLGVYAIYLVVACLIICWILPKK